jgi:hypothetical protein
MSRQLWKITTKQLAGREFQIPITVYATYIDQLCGRNKRTVSFMYQHPYPFFSIQHLKFKRRSDANRFANWVSSVTKKQ